jgi:hypothetical protein
MMRVASHICAVMPGLVPGIHVFVVRAQDVDGQDFCANARKTRFALLPGHDEIERFAP